MRIRSEKLECLKIKLSQCHFVHYKTHTNYPGIEPAEKPSSNALGYDTVRCLFAGLHEENWNYNVPPESFWFFNYFVLKTVFNHHLSPFIF
jgi:hypothetical protein